MSEKIFNINNIDNNNNDLLVDSKSSISDYYRGKSILITGATGFCGKVILAKLLNSLGIIEKVYILIRPKNGISGAERFEKMINDRPFSLRPISTSLIHKIRVIEGDAIEKNLGLTENETNELLSHVNLIIHVAASVKFIATVRYNMQHNVYSAKILVDLASKMEKLDCFVYVSSAYSNCHLTEIDEKLYPLKISSHEIINLFRILGDETAEMVAQELFEGRPNSYVFSKAVAEHIVHNLTKYNKTVSIVRPSIVAPSFEFPVPGWVDSINGPMSLALLWCTGLMCVIDYDFVTTTDFVPVDVVAYGVLAAPWFMSKSKTNFKIFNLVRKDFIKGDWDSYEFLKSGQRSFMKAPPSIVMRPNHKPCRFNDRPRWKYLVERFFYHTIYAFLLDIIIFILGHRPLLLRNVKKMHAAVDAMKYFGERQWIFRSENTLEMIRSMSPADLDEYRLSKSALSCSDICDIFWMGTRRYILKQSEKSIKSAKKRYLISIFVYRIFLAMIFYLLIQLVWPLFSGILPDFFCRKVFAISICCIMIARDIRILVPLLSEKPSYDLMNNRKDKNSMKKLQNDG